VIVYKVKVVGEGFVKHLPTRYSERSYFSMTQIQSEAQAFREKEFENMDLEWLRECYNYEKEVAEMIEVELITTLANSEEENLIKEENDA